MTQADIDSRKVWVKTHGHFVGRNMKKAKQNTKFGGIFQPDFVCVCVFFRGL